jgi:hypothetical protein
MYIYISLILFCRSPETVSQVTQTEGPVFPIPLARSQADLWMPDREVRDIDERTGGAFKFGVVPSSMILIRGW